MSMLYIILIARTSDNVYCVIMPGQNSNCICHITDCVPKGNVHCIARKIINIIFLYFSVEKR